MNNSCRQLGQETHDAREMSSEFCILDLEPEVLAPKVTAARKRLGWSIAELARVASVEFSSVARVENSNQEPGILTSLNIAVAAQVADISGFEPEPETLEFAQMLGTDLSAAAYAFQAVAEDYLSGSVGGRQFVPANLFYLYNASPKLARLQLLKPRAKPLGQIGADVETMATPLPQDLGSVSCECLRAYRRAKSRSGSRAVPTIKSSEATFWSHISVGRTVNVGARRLIASLRIIENLLESQKGMSKQDYLDLATRVFVNHHLLEKAYETQLTKSGLSAMLDFWKIMYDFILMRSAVHPAESPNRKRSKTKKSARSIQ